MYTLHFLLFCKQPKPISTLGNLCNSCLWAEYSLPPLPPHQHHSGIYSMVTSPKKFSCHSSYNSLSISHFLWHYPALFLSQTSSVWNIISLLLMYYRHPPNSMRVGTLSSSESYFQYLKKDQAHIMLSINMYWMNEWIANFSNLLIPRTHPHYIGEMFCRPRQLYCN